MLVSLAILTKATRICAPQTFLDGARTLYRQVTRSQAPSTSTKSRTCARESKPACTWVLMPGPPTTPTLSRASVLPSTLISNTSVSKIEQFSLFHRSNKYSVYSTRMQKLSDCWGNFSVRKSQDFVRCSSRYFRSRRKQ